MLGKKIVKYGSSLVAVSVVVALGLQFLVPPAYADQGHQATMTVYASGLTNPRGLTFGPDGDLYVAEGGTDNNTMSTTPDQCDQVPGAGPYKGGFNSSIVKISPNGDKTTVADGLPSNQTNPQLGNLVTGVADLAFIGHTLYGIEAGAGCSHGLAGTDNTVFRVNSDGTTTTIADLSEYLKANPVANPEPDDFEPDGTWYSMLSIGSNLYALEPNHGELDRIQLNGKIHRVVDISASQGHIVPTSLAYYHGNFYVGNLYTFPVDPGSSQIMKINKGGQIKSITHGLTTVLGLAFDEEGRMYALESVPDAGFPQPDTFVPDTGRVVRVNRDGTLTTIISGLNFPSAMTMGPDGALYVSNFGFGVNVPGSGQIMRIAINN